jgi:hypothetical protein
MKLDVAERDEQRRESDQSHQSAKCAQRPAEPA